MWATNCSNYWNPSANHILLLLSLLILMAIAKGSVSSGPMATDRVHFTDPCGTIDSFMKSQHIGLHSVSQRVEFRKPGNGNFMGAKLRFSTWGTWHIYGKSYDYTGSREQAVLCLSTGTQDTEANECVRCSEDCSDRYRQWLCCIFVVISVCYICIRYFTARGNCTLFWLIKQYIHLHSGF